MTEGYFFASVIGVNLGMWASVLIFGGEHRKDFATGGTLAALLLYGLFVLNS